MGFLKRLVGVIFSFWFLLTFVALVAGAAALVVYRMHFVGGFSTQAADWSAFGSYIGGVLGPLVSFLTLGAVLRTVYLQRDLLRTQKDEFFTLRQQQIASLQRQDDQLQLSRDEAERSLVQNYLNSQFRLIEFLVDNQQRHADAMSSVVFKIMDLGQGSFTDRQTAAEPSLKEKEMAVANVKELLILSMQLSLSEFKATKEIKDFVGPCLLKIIRDQPETEGTSPAG